LCINLAAAPLFDVIQTKMKHCVTNKELPADLKKPTLLHVLRVTDFHLAATIAN
jgi:hypothetical protein